MLPTVFIPEQRSSNTLSTAHALETKKARLKAGLKRRGYSAGIIASADSSDLQLIKDAQHSFMCDADDAIHFLLGRDQGRSKA